jgi:ParB family chromosome partitioning protein
MSVHKEGARIRNARKAEGSPEVLQMSPFDCRMWDLHDRLDHLINESTCRAELESFQKHGQLVPALGRRLHGDPTHKVELIYGARRLFCARHLNIPLKVELREIADRDALVAMDVENRLRTDISPYERGRSYLRWLRTGHFRSQDEIAHSLKISGSQVCRLLKLAQLPSVILDVFENPADIFEGWGLELTQALEDPARRAATISKARELGAMQPRLNPREAYRTLLAASAPGRKIKPPAHDEVVKSEDGDPLFRIRYQRNSIAIVLPVTRVGAAPLERIRCAVRTALSAEPQAV